MGVMDIESDFLKIYRRKRSQMNSPFKILNDDKLALIKTNITNYNN